MNLVDDNYETKRDRKHAAIAKTRHDELREQAQAFHEKHPEVWRLFCEFALRVIRRGRRNYSIGAIWEAIRWHTEIGDGDAPEASFSLNNNHRAFYARRFMKAYPQHAGFFRTRTQTSLEHDAVDLPPLTPNDFPTYPIPPDMVARPDDGGFK